MGEEFGSYRQSLQITACPTTPKAGVVPGPIQSFGNTQVAILRRGSKVGWDVHLLGEKPLSDEVARILKRVRRVAAR